jgi:anti-sigma B factor antagonist
MSETRTAVPIYSNSTDTEIAVKTFTVRREHRNALPVLRIRGEVDLCTAPRLQEAVLAALSTGARSLAIDLSRVDFMDSTGLHVLLNAKKRTAARGGDVYVLGADQRILRLFQLVGLEKVFHLCREADLPGR